MGGFMDKAKEFADQHDEQVDQGMEKAGDFADEKTGGKYDEQIDRGVDTAQERTDGGRAAAPSVRRPVRTAAERLGEVVGLDRSPGSRGEHQAPVSGRSAGRPRSVRPTETRYRMSSRDKYAARNNRGVRRFSASR